MGAIVPFPTPADEPALTLLPGGATEEAVGIASAGLIGPEGPILAILGGVLTELLGNNNAAAQRVQDAINTALAANVAGNTQQMLNWGSLAYSMWKVNAALDEDAASAAWQAAQAFVRLRNDLTLLTENTAGVVSESELVADVNSIEAQLSTLTQFTIQNIETEQATRAAQIDQVTQALQAGLAQMAAQAAADAQAAQATAEAVSTAQAQDVEKWTEGVVAEVSADLSSVVAQINADLATLSAYVSTIAAQAEAYAQTATEQGLGSLQAGQATQVVTTLSPGWAGTAQSANQAAETLTQEHPEEAQNLSLVPTSTPADAAAAIGALATIARTATQALNDCALPNCNLKNSLANQAKNLLNAAGDGALLAALVYAATDPTEAAHDIERIFGGLVSEIVRAARAAVGFVT